MRYIAVQWVFDPQDVAPLRAQTPRPNSADNISSENVHFIAKHITMQTLDQHLQSIRSLLKKEHDTLVEEAEWIAAVLDSETEYAAA